MFEKGDLVQVQFTGQVFWTGKDNYGNGQRVGIRLVTPDGKALEDGIFIAAATVAPVRHPALIRHTLEALKRQREAAKEEEAAAEPVAATAVPAPVPVDPVRTAAARATVAPRFAGGAVKPAEPAPPPSKPVTDRSAMFDEMREFFTG